MAKKRAPRRKKVVVPVRPQITATNRRTGELFRLDAEQGDVHFDLESETIRAEIIELMDDGKAMLRLSVGMWRYLTITPITPTEVLIEVRVARRT